MSEGVPWAAGNHLVTTTSAWFLAQWAKRLSWREVATIFHTSWDTVYRSVVLAVEWGRAHLDLTGIEAIGVDELQWQRGHRYLTVVYQIDAARKAPAGDRAGPHEKDAPAVLPLVRQRAHPDVAVRLRRHVEGVPHGRRQEGRACVDCRVLQGTDRGAMGRQAR
jgi:hypothetical protein